MQEAGVRRLVLNRQHPLEKVALAEGLRQLMGGIRPVLDQFQMNLLAEGIAWGSHSLSGDSGARQIGAKPTAYRTVCASDADF
jgi:hypothetical protein